MPKRKRRKRLGLTCPERARLALEGIIAAEAHIGPCVVYHIGYSLYVNGLNSDLNGEQIAEVAKICRRSGLHACVESGPRGDWITEGNPLTLSNGQFEAITAFIQSVVASGNPDAEPENFVLPGCIINAWLEEVNQDPAYVVIAFPVQKELLSEKDIWQQAQFACQIIDRLGYSCDVVLNGVILSARLWIQEGACKTHPEELVKQYQCNPMARRTPAIRRHVNTQVESCLDIEDELRTWLRLADRSFKPGTVQVLNSRRGILGYQGYGCVLIFGDDMPEDLLKRIGKLLR